MGLNFRSHAKEASVGYRLVWYTGILALTKLNEQLSPAAYPPLWMKPAASLAHPSEDIPINEFCAKSMLDYEVWREHDLVSTKSQLLTSCVCVG